MSAEPNIYRDGKHIVAPVENAIFPNKCVKTNQPVDSVDHSISFEAHLLKKGEQAPETEIGLVIRGISRRRKLTLNIGLCDERKKRSKFLKTLGLSMVIVGPILGFLLAMMVAPKDQPGGAGEMGVLFFIMMGIGFAVMIAGLILFAISSGTVLRADECYETHVKLAGACKEYLEDLPNRAKFSFE